MRSGCGRCAEAAGAFSGACGVAARAYPFGKEGPGLEAQLREKGVVLLCVQGFVAFGMVGTLLALGGGGFGLLSAFSWALTTLFAVASFVEYWALQHEVAGRLTVAMRG